METHNSREKILEQSLVQQNQIVEMLQKTVASLESENESAREKISALERRVHHLSMWKARARLAEERLKEMADSAGVLGSSSAGVISLSAISSFEKVLAEKDKTITSLQSRLGREEGESGMVAGEDTSSSMSTQAKLAAERVKVLELEEELLLSHEDSSKARGELADCRSDAMRRESEIQYLRHEMEAVRQVTHQQQDVVMGLRAALLDRDAQISSLTRALERTLQEGRRRSSVTHSSAYSPFSHQNLFDLLLGRDVFNVELSRDAPNRELGLSVSRFEMPISSRMSGLIVRAVREGSSAQGLLTPGDEILEVNGLNCRNTSQKKAVEILERGVGSIKIVVAREKGPSAEFVRIRISPIVSDTSHSNSKTANDASFAATSSRDPPSPLPSPQHYDLSLPTSPASAPPFTVGDIPPASHVRPQPIGQVKMLEPVGPDEQVTGGEDEHVSEDKKTEGGSELRVELLKLREEAGQWQLLQGELEGELDALHNELEAVKMEYELTTAENFDLQQQVKVSATELADIQGQVEELQQLLEGVREKIGREEERTCTLEQQNKDLHKAVVEANSARDIERQKVSEVEEEMMQLKLDCEQEKSDLSTKVASLQSHNQQLQADVRQRADQLESAQTHAREDERKIESERTEWQLQMQQVKADLQTLREEAAKTASSSQIEVEKLQSQLTTVKSLLMSAEKKEAEMKIEIRHLSQAADESNRQLEEMHENYRTLRAQAAKFREQAEEKTLECETLTLGLKRTQCKLQANKDTLSRQQNEITNLRRSNKELLVERVKADEVRSKAEVQLRISRSEQAQVREKLQGQTGERDELFSQLETLAAENTALQEQLDDAREKLEEANTEKEQLSHQLEQSQNEIQETKDSLEEVSGVRKGLESELLLEQSKASQLKATLTGIEATVEGIRAGRKTSDNLVASMSFVHEQDQTRVKELEESLSRAREDLERMSLEASRTQEEQSKEVQQLSAECACLRERVKGLSAQMEEEREARGIEVEAVKEKLSCSDLSVRHLQTELEAQESVNSINQATISQLQTASEQAEEERVRVQKSLQEALQRNHQLQLEVDKLQSHSRQLETEVVERGNEVEHLSENCADLNMSLKQTRTQTDTLNAKLQAAEINLATTQQRLDEATLQGRKMQRTISELEEKFRESEKNLELAESREKEITLSLHAREEEISQLKTQIELSQSEHGEMQSSFTLLQSATKSQDKKIKSLEKERANLKMSLEQFEAAQHSLKRMVTSLEKGKVHLAEQHQQEMERLTQQLDEKIAAEKEHLVIIQRLERLHSEAQSTVEELLAAQDALKSSLTALGDDKEVEVVRLQEQLVTLQVSLVSSQQQASQARSREEKLQTELMETSESGRIMSQKLSELQDENEQLREEVESLRTTETQLAELLHKLNVLEQSQREKSSKMVAMQGELEVATKELHRAQTENATLLGRVGEVAAMTVSLAEKTAELERVKGELVAEVKGRLELADEKQQLLGVLRRLEVEKHTTAVPVAPESQPTLQDAGREVLLQAMREKEEEALRLREYVGKLLAAVVEKAPFVLERIPT